MLIKSHEKKFLKLVQKGDYKKIYEYIFYTLSQLNSEELSFLDVDYTERKGYISKNKPYFHLFIDLGWPEIIKLIFEGTNYIPTSINLDCDSISFDRLDNSLAFHEYIKQIKKCIINDSPSNIKHFEVNKISIPFKNFNYYKDYINKKLNGNKETETDFVYEDYFDFIGYFYERLSQYDISNIFNELDEHDKDESKFLLKIPNIFSRYFVLKDSFSYVKAFEGLLNFGDEDWIKTNFLVQSFNKQLFFKDTKDILKIIKTNQKKNIDQLYGFEKNKIEKTCPKFYNPKEGVIVIEENDTFLIINFLNNRCLVKETENCISFDTEGKTTGIKTEDFYCNEDFEKFKIFILETIKGRNPEFPEIINGEKPSLSIEHE